MKRAASILLLVFLVVGTHLTTAQTTVFIGTDTTTVDQFNYPAPYGNWYTCSKHQMVILASELQAQGLGEGYITSLGFSVQDPNGVALLDFTLKIKQTTEDTITSFDNTGLTTVFGPVDYTDVVGWNMHPFSNAFYWDGTSNLLIETCFCNGVSSSTLNARMHYSTSTFNTVVYARDDADANHCSSPGTQFFSANRPNMRVEGFTSAPIDAGVISISPPPDGCALSDSEMVSVSVQNFGTDSIFSVDMFYRVDGGAPVMETMTDTISPNVPMTYVFVTPADLSAIGVHVIDAWTKLVGDTTAFNDTTSGEQVEHYAPVSAFPMLEDFESQTSCLEQCGAPCSLSGNWSNDPNADIDWTVDFGGTPTLNTGPLVDHTLGNSSGKYIYTAASGCSSMEAIILGPCINFDSVSNPVLNFYYFMYGGATGELHVEVDSAGIWLSLMSVIGEQQTSGNDAWLDATIDLSTLAGTTRLRIRALTGGSATSDIAIDDLLIYDNMPDDAGVTAITSPVSGCDLSAIEPVTITVKNYGSLAQNTIPVAYSLDGGPAVLDTVFGALATFASVNFTFSTPANLSGVGVHTIDAWTQLSNDIVTVNDSTIGTQMENYALISSFPFVFDVESESNCGVSCGAVCLLSGAWENLSSDDIDWTVHASATATSFTGPAVDNTLGTTSGKYLYLEANSCSFTEAVLLSPCLNLTAMSYPTLRFFYHMYGSNMGELYVDIDSNGTWINLLTVLGEVQTSDSDPWMLVDLDLSPYSGVTRMRVRGITGAGITSDMAIDDLKIFDKPAKDVGVISIDAPLGPCLYNGETVTVQVKNFGSLAQDTIPVTYTVNGGSPVTETILVNLLPAATMTYTFSTVANLGAGGTYVIESYTALVGDTDFNNDTTRNDTINNLPTVAYFTMSGTVSCQGSSISFMDSSSNSPTSWSWDFGNGNTSTIQNPVAVYAGAGVYTVTLTVTNACNTDIMVLSSAVTITGGPKTAVCNPSVQDINNDIGIKNVVFNSISNNTDTLKEGYTDYGCDFFTTFEAGSSQTLTVTTGTSWAENVRAWIDYNNDGAFDASELIMTSNNTIGTHTAQIIIQQGVLDTLLRLRIASDYGTVAAPGPCDTLVYGQVEDYGVTVTPSTQPPEATFTFTVQNYCPATVQFTDNSTFFPNSWSWDFGDGNQGTAAQVTHVYASAGTYSVTLIVTNAFGSDTLVQSVLIDTVVADFVVQDTAALGENILFQNTSSGADTYQWDFGDLLGSPFESPNHSYSVAGSYVVSLQVTNTTTGCTDTQTQTIYILPDTTNSIWDQDFRSMITIAPNPSNGLVTFSSNFNNALGVELSIFNMLGEKVFEKTLGRSMKSEIAIDLRAEAQGVYLFKVKVLVQGDDTISGYQFSQKILIQK